MIQTEKKKQLFERFDLYYTFLLSNYEVFEEQTFDDKKKFVQNYKDIFYISAIITLNNLQTIIAKSFNKRFLIFVLANDELDDFNKLNDDIQLLIINLVDIPENSLGIMYIYFSIYYLQIANHTEIYKVEYDTVLNLVEYGFDEKFGYDFHKDTN